MKKKTPFISKLPIEQMKPVTTTDNIKMTETKHGLHFKILKSH